jgi:hypothetical protein
MFTPLSILSNIVFGGLLYRARSNTASTQSVPWESGVVILCSLARLVFFLSPPKGEPRVSWLLSLSAASTVAGEFWLLSAWVSARRKQRAPSVSLGVGASIRAGPARERESRGRSVLDCDRAFLWAWDDVASFAITSLAACAAMTLSVGALGGAARSAILALAVAAHALPPFFRSALDGPSASGTAKLRVLAAAAAASADWRLGAPLLCVGALVCAALSELILTHADAKLLAAVSTARSGVAKVWIDLVYGEEGGRRRDATAASSFAARPNSKVA